MAGSRPRAANNRQGLDRKAKVLAILNGPIAARIRFRLPATASHYEIRPHLFQIVANAIQKGRVTVRPPMGLPSDITAEYSGAEEKRDFGIVVPANTLRSGRFPGLRRSHTPFTSVCMRPTTCCK